MATPAYQGNSVVDYLKSTGGDSSFSSRQALAVKQGLVKSAGEYIGSAAQNTALLGSLRKVSAAPASVTEAINSGQDEDIANTPAADDAPTRSETRTKRYSTAFSEISDIFKPAGSAPEAPNFTDIYKKQKKALGIDDLEAYVNDLQTEEEQIFADVRGQRTAERGKTVAMNVIEGKIGEEERAAQERIDYVTRQKNSAVRQLQNANAAIENLVNFTKLDYETARNSYNDQFSQQTAMFNIVKGVVDSEMTDEENEANTARANLNIIYSAIKEGDIDKASINPTMQYRINQMELSAGLPTGFYNNIQNQNPTGKILSTTTRTSGNAKYADVLIQNKDGSITSKAVYLGADASGSGGGTTDDKEITKFRSDASEYIQKLDRREIGWGAAFNAIKAKYPQASNELIDQTLNKEAYYTIETARDPITGAAVK